MEKVLITGGAGFIGSTLANSLADTYSIFVIDDLSMGKKENIVDSKNITFVQGSVTDPALMTEILTANDFKFIFHLAAIASVADSVERPVETHAVNFDSVLLLLELCRKYQKKLTRLVFASSAAVYGDEATLPKQEESVIRPLTPYAIDKFAAEQYVVDYYHLYGMPTTAVRFFNVYGPNQNPSSPYSGVISILMDHYQKLLNNVDTQFTIFGDGNQARDFIYVEDVLQALLLVATKEEALGEQFNVGTGKTTTLLELIAIIDQILNKKMPLCYQTERAGDIKISVADINKLKKLTFAPKNNIQLGLKKYIATQSPPLSGHEG